MNGAIIAAIVIGTAVYFIPTIIAVERKATSFQEAALVTIINTFFGWSLLGWGIALAIAITIGQRQPEQPQPAND